MMWKEVLRKVTLVARGREGLDLGGTDQPAPGKQEAFSLGDDMGKSGKTP